MICKTLEATTQLLAHELDVDFQRDGAALRVVLDGEAVSDRLRSEECGSHRYETWQPEIHYGKNAENADGQNKEKIVGLDLENIIKQKHYSQTTGKHYYTPVP